MQTRGSLSGSYRSPLNRSHFRDCERQAMRITRLALSTCLAIGAVVFIARTATAQDAKADLGKTLFMRRSSSGCHGIGKVGQMPRPDLSGATARRSNESLLA